MALQVGIPAKSGVSGGLMLVVPGLFGLCLFSPPLDAHGNSCRCVQFSQVTECPYQSILLDAYLIYLRFFSSVLKRPSEHIMHLLR